MNQDERETQESPAVDPVAVVEAEIARLEAQMYKTADRRDELYRAVIEPYDAQVRAFSGRINRLYEELKRLRR